MKKVAKLAALGTVAGAAIALGMASPAYAESSWTGYINNAESGFESRSWYDNNLDSTNGYVRFDRCNQNPTIAVYREDGGPDTEVKRGRLTCVNGSGYLYFGDVARGRYHFTVKNTGGSQDLDVDNVVVWF